MNVRRGRHRSIPIRLWVDPKQLKQVDLICEKKDKTRPAVFEEALDLLIDANAPRQTSLTAQDQIDGMRLGRQY